MCVYVHMSEKTLLLEFFSDYAGIRHFMGKLNVFRPYIGILHVLYI
jgi:hypothetical protein